MFNKMEDNHELSREEYYTPEFLFLLGCPIFIVLFLSVFWVIEAPQRKSAKERPAKEAAMEQWIAEQLHEHPKFIELKAEERELLENPRPESSVTLVGSRDRVGDSYFYAKNFYITNNRTPRLRAISLSWKYNEGPHSRYHQTHNIPNSTEHIQLNPPLELNRARLILSLDSPSSDPYRTDPYFVITRAEYEDGYLELERAWNTREQTRIIRGINELESNLRREGQRKFFPSNSP
jgi:hypothetical protein